MKGTVIGLSKDKQRAAVLTDLGYTVFDTEYDDLSIGDSITGNLNDHGFQVLTNQTTGRKLSAYIDAIQATQEAARSLLACK